MSRANTSRACGQVASVRIVGRPHKVVAPHERPVADPDRVVHERGEDLPLQVSAGRGASRAWARQRERPPLSRAGSLLRSGAELTRRNGVEQGRRDSKPEDQRATQDPGVQPMPIVVVQPARHRVAPLVRVVIGAGRRPTRATGLVKAFGRSVGLAVTPAAWVEVRIFRSARRSRRADAMSCLLSGCLRGGGVARYDARSRRGRRLRRSPRREASP